MAAQVCPLVPGLTWDAFCWRLPLAAAGHLCAAACRAAGTPTPRPVDFAALFAQAPHAKPPPDQP